jgi:ankyrin repeat protein
LDVLKVLLKLGADPTLRETGSGLTPIHFAVERGRDILELLLGSCRPGFILLLVYVLISITFNISF